MPASFKTEDLTSKAYSNRARYYHNTRLQIDLFLARVRRKLGYGNRPVPGPPEDLSPLALAFRALNDTRAERRHTGSPYYQRIDQLMADYVARLNAITFERLGEQEIADITHFSTLTEFVSRISERELLMDEAIFTRPDSDLYIKEKGARFLVEMIERHRSEVRSVLNVGARIDPALHFAAKRYPDIKFVSLDFQPNLRQQNEAAFGRPLPANWRFLSGYPRDMFKAGLRADMVFFMSTSVLLGKQEFRRMMDAFVANNVKFVVFSESWYPRLKGWRIGHLRMPEDLPPERLENGGATMIIHRNYPFEMERVGFVPEVSRLHDDYRTGTYFVLNFAARNPAACE